VVALGLYKLLQDAIWSCLLAVEKQMPELISIQVLDGRASASRGVLAACILRLWLGFSMQAVDVAREDARGRSFLEELLEDVLAGDFGLRLSLDRAIN
jgi:hypothetical protein